VARKAHIDSGWPSTTDAGVTGHESLVEWDPEGAATARPSTGTEPDDGERVHRHAQEADVLVP